jgi:DNA-binding HxlR family transcriptional regulator
MLKQATTVRRQYHGGCPVAHALDQLGHRWTIPVIKELLFGGMRFSALKSRLPGIGPNVLIQRLTELEEMGLVRKREMAEPVAVNIYELTELGFDARPLIVSLARWAAHLPVYEISQPLSSASLMILLEASLISQSARDLECELDFKVGTDRFTVTFSGGEIEIERGESVNPAATISGTTAAICSFVFAGAKLISLESDGRIAVAGDRELVLKLPEIFRRPD